MAWSPPRESALLDCHHSTTFLPCVRRLSAPISMDILSFALNWNNSVGALTNTESHSSALFEDLLSISLIELIDWGRSLPIKAERTGGGERCRAGFCRRAAAPDRSEPPPRRRAIVIETGGTRAAARTAAEVWTVGVWTAPDEAGHLAGRTPGSPGDGRGMAAACGRRAPAAPNYARQGGSGGPSRARHGMPLHHDAARRAAAGLAGARQAQADMLERISLERIIPGRPGWCGAAGMAPLAPSVRNQLLGRAAAPPGIKAQASTAAMTMSAHSPSDTPTIRQRARRCDQRPSAARRARPAREPMAGPAAG